MAKRKEITVRCFVSLDGAESVPLQSLSKQQRQEVSDRIAKNFAVALNEYYSQHPEEYATFPDLSDKYNIDEIE